MHFNRAPLRRLLAAGIALCCLAFDAMAQSPLQNVSVFSTVAGLNTVPDHGDHAVSYLDYRAGGYSIVVVDIATMNEDELARPFYAEPVVSTFGDRVAWIGYTPLGQADVHVHDRSTETTTRITNDAAFQNHPDLSSEVLVWQDYRNAGSDQLNADIYLHDFASATTSAVTTDPGYQDLPRVHGSRIVWQDFRHSDSLTTADIYLYDLRSGEESRLTSGTVYRAHPEIWSDLVVWEDYRNGENGDIYLYDLGASREIRITTNPAHQAYPAVYGEWVVWLDYRHSSDQGDLYGYHLATEEEYPLLLHSAHQEAPHVFANHLVWQDYRDDRFDIFGGSLVDPTNTTIDEPLHPPSSRLIAAPNPFAHSVTFELDRASGGTSELTIYDIMGRKIARMPISSAGHQTVWNGRDDSGRPVPAGLYIAITRDGSRTSTVVVVRR